LQDELSNESYGDGCKIVKWDNFHYETTRDIYYDVRLIDSNPTHFKAEMLPESKFETVYQPAVFQRVKVTDTIDVNVSIVGKSIPVDINSKAKESSSPGPAHDLAPIMEIRKNQFN
jgi:hypothetical protein